MKPLPARLGVGVADGHAEPGAGGLLGRRVLVVGAGQRPLDLGGSGRRSAQAASTWRRTQCGLGVDVEAGEDQLHLVAQAAEVVEADLGGRRRRGAADAADPDPVRRRPGSSRTVSRWVVTSGFEVVGGLHLVEQLGGDGVDGDQAAGAGVLGDHAAAVGGDLGDREAQRTVAAAGVEQRPEAAEVAAGGLGAALDDVPGDHRPGQRVVVVAPPAEVGDRRGRGRPRRR